MKQHKLPPLQRGAQCEAEIALYLLLLLVTIIAGMTVFLVVAWIFN